MGLGLSGIVPTMHFTIEEGFVKATTVGQMGWFYLMGAMYITGAGLYAARIPERYFPGKCDIWVSALCLQDLHFTFTLNYAYSLKKTNNGFSLSVKNMPFRS